MGHTVRPPVGRQITFTYFCSKRYHHLNNKIKNKINKRRPKNKFKM